MNLAVILIRCSTAETPLVLEKFSSKMRFRNVPTDRWSEDDIRVRGARGWTAIVDPLLLLPHEHDACRAISRAMQTDVIGAMWETVSGTFVFGLHRSGSPVRSFSVSDGIVVHSSGEPLAGEPPLAEMTVHDVMRLVERAAIPVNAIEDADDLLHLGMELVQKLDPLDEAEYRAHWPAHQQMMTLAVTQFPPEMSTVTRMIGRAQGPEDRAWNALSGALGVAGAVVGERRTAAGPGVPSLAGIVELARDAPPQILLRIDEPASGYALVGVFTHDGHVHTILDLRLFGHGAGEIAAREEPLWRAWMDARFSSAQRG